VYDRFQTSDTDFQLCHHDSNAKRVDGDDPDNS
jgi:hypothetical protein